MYFTELKIVIIMLGYVTIKKKNSRKIRVMQQKRSLLSSIKRKY